MRFCEAQKLAFQRSQTAVDAVHLIDKGFDAPLLHTVRGAGYMIRDGDP